MRNLNNEIGLRQNGPTVIYQDNHAAIQIAMNHGSLSRRTRATETRNHFRCFHVDGDNLHIFNFISNR